MQQLLLLGISCRSVVGCSATTSAASILVHGITAITGHGVIPHHCCSQLWHLQVLLFPLLLLLRLR
jgi:hypothetical protein